MDFPAPYTRTVPHTQTAPSYIPVAPMHLNFSILASCPPRPARGCGRPAQAATRTHQTPPGNSQKNRKVCNPASHRSHTATHASQIPMHPGFLYGPCLYTFPRIPHTTAKLQKIRHQFRRDQRLVHSNLRIQPVFCRFPAPTTEGSGTWRRFAARIPGEPGQAEPGKSPQIRRRIRRTDDGSRRPPARPGVMLALRRWGIVSLSF